MLLKSSEKINVPLRKEGLHRRGFRIFIGYLRGTVRQEFDCLSRGQLNQQFFV